jgi:hypothetical protein
MVLGIGEGVNSYLDCVQDLLYGMSSIKNMCVMSHWALISDGATCSK